MKETRAWILVIGILAIAAWLAFTLLNSVQDMVGSVKGTTSCDPGEPIFKPYTNHFAGAHDHYKRGPYSGKTGDHPVHG